MKIMITQTTVAPKVIATALAAAIILFFGAQTAFAASTLFGGAAQTGDYITLVSNSDADPSNDYSGVSFNDANGMTFGSLTALSADYNITDDNCGGGSPRFSIGLDTNNDSVADGYVHTAIGPSPSFTGCAAGWQNTGNVIGNNDAGRYDFGQFGGSAFTTYSNAPANVLAGEVTEIAIVVDGSWSAAATGGDGEQTVLVDNTNVNGTVFDFTRPTRNINSSSFTISVTNRGSIDNGTFATSTTGGNTALGSIGGVGGDGGNVTAGIGNENNGGATSGNGGNGGNGGAGGLVDTGDASADAQTANDLNTTDGELAYDCACGDINGLTVGVTIDNDRVAPTQNNVVNVTQARARTGENLADGSTGGSAGNGGLIGAGAGDENNGGATSGSGGAGGSGNLGGTVGTGSAWSNSITVNSVNFTRFRLQ